MQTWIIHLDMDAFFASVEQLDHPEWRGKPLIVGGDGERGVVSTCSYEARKFGVHSAMPIFKAKKLCPHAIITNGNRSRYVEISQQVMETLRGFSPVVEQASIDEAYVDASGLKRLFGPVESLGKQIKEAVFKKTGLTCSIGIAPVKFLAKISSDMNKPDGLTILTPEQVSEFVRALPLSKIPGLGKKTQQLLAGYGMRTAGDAQQYSEEFWVTRFGKTGLAIYERCHGIDHRKVEPYTEAKSESAENTFSRDTNELDELKTWLLRQSERIGASMRRHGYKGRTITLKLKHADFTQVTRSFSLPHSTNSTRLIYEVGVRLLEEITPLPKLRLIGIGVSNFEGQHTRSQPRGHKDSNQTASPIDGFFSLTQKGYPPETPLSHGAELTLPGIRLKTEGTTLLENLDYKKEAALDQTLDKVRGKFGNKAIVRGRLFKHSHEK